MTRLASIKLIFLFLFILPLHPAYAQKIKYKDIYALLSAKQYDAAEPLLSRYLKETTDNPNAYLYMGMVLQEKALKDDILKHTALTISHIDSAVVFYDKAHKSVTEKEIKKNSEFYQAYNRRDLRSGEFGVKLSDIQFDLEKRMEGLRERIDRIKMTKHYFALSDTLYKKTNAVYRSLQAKYPGRKEFYLRADDAAIKELSAMIARFDSCLKSFDQYKSSLSVVGKTGNNSSISLEPINDFKTDGASPSNFYTADVKVWDYKKFALESKHAIEKEILPVRAGMLAYDAELNKLKETLSKQNVSVSNELAALTDKSLKEQLTKHDPEPLPMQVFALKRADLAYRSTLVENSHAADSAHVAQKLKALNKELFYLNEIDSIASRLLSNDLDRRSLDYDFFVKNTFESAVALKNFLTASKEFAVREKATKTSQLAARSESLKWVISGRDSIPLFITTKTAFRPLSVVDEKYTTGICYADTLNPMAYLYTITASRSPEVKVKFPLDKQTFGLTKFSSAKTLAYADNTGHLYLVLLYSELANDDQTISASVAKIYKSDGLAWNTNHRLAFIPREMLFSPETGEITLIGERGQQNTLDKNGRLVK
jgi:hypothetical protein